MLGAKGQTTGVVSRWLALVCADVRKEDSSLANVKADVATEVCGAVTVRAEVSVSLWINSGTGTCKGGSIHARNGIASAAKRTPLQASRRNDVAFTWKIAKAIPATAATTSARKAGSAS